MIKNIAIIFILSFLVAGCGKPIPDTSLPTISIPDEISNVSNTPTVPPQPSHTPTIEATEEPSPTVSPTSEPTPLPAPSIRQEPGPLYDTIVQIPVSEGGIQYRGAGVTDMDPVGPNGIVVAPDGMLIIGDVYGNRLMRYSATGTRLEDIDLTALDILDISDLVGIGDALYILEISFKVLPERYRVSQLTTDGQLISRYDLPKGFHFEDGLFGLAVGYPENGNPQILIQFGNADDSSYYLLPETSEGSPEKLPALPVFGKDLHMQSADPGELAVSTIGTQEFESQMTAGGTIFLLNARADGSLYLQRDDLVAWEPITTDITIHYVTPEGKVAGIARYPIMDWYFHVWRFLTVGPDGNVYGLITREQSVDVLRLNFYDRLEPIINTAAEPAIRSLSANSTFMPFYDCSLVRHIPTDSAEAGQIVDSLIANYKQDRPTEYLAFEQLWSVDRVGDYAILEGMVTQEETDIIVAQETERGFVLVAWYIGQLPTPGLRHGDIPGYFAVQLPQAPPEVFYCPDLSRFKGDN